MVDVVDDDDGDDDGHFDHKCRHNVNTIISLRFWFVVGLVRHRSEMVACLFFFFFFFVSFRRFVLPFSPFPFVSFTLFFK